jgi:hypothetical protein
MMMFAPLRSPTLIVKIANDTLQAAFQIRDDFLSILCEAGLKLQSQVMYGAFPLEPDSWALSSVFASHSA